MLLSSIISNTDLLPDFGNKINQVAIVIPWVGFPWKVFPCKSISEQNKYAAFLHELLGI